MNIIDPSGLQQGERLAACSDLAQLHWPRLFLASNGYARLELSYQAIAASVYRNFAVPPTEDQLWRIFEEFAENFLVILYEVEGTWWAQFSTSEKYLPRYKTTRDNSSPAPPLEAVERHRSGYIEWKRSKSVVNQRFQKFSGTSENLPKISAAVAVAVAVADADVVAVADVGEKERSARPSAPSARSITEDPDLFPEAWNRLCGPLPSVRDFTKSRRAKVEARQRQGLTIVRFEEAVTKCASTPFLSGSNDRGWRGTFDWLIANDTTIPKVLEGHYDGSSLRNEFMGIDVAGLQ